MIPTQGPAKGDLIVSAAERRLTLQLLSYWERLRGLRPMPTEGDISSDDLGELWEDCFLIQESNQQLGSYQFIHLGSNIQSALSGRIINIGTKPEDAHMKHLAPSVAKVISSIAPVIEEGELLNELQQFTKYRQCLLPLGDNGKVLAVFGGMRCKIYADEHTIQ